MEGRHLKICGTEELIPTRSPNFKSALLSALKIDVMAFAQIAPPYIA